MHRLKAAIMTLAAALRHELGLREIEEIDQTIEDFDLSNDELVPAWILEMLETWAAGRTTGDWVPFELVGMEASDTLQFLAEVPRWLPITIANQGERWSLTSLRLPNEAIIAFEGDVYLVKPVGTPEPGEGDLPKDA